MLTGPEGCCSLENVQLSKTGRTLISLMFVRTKKVMVAAGFCRFPSLSNCEVQKIWERAKKEWSLRVRVGIGKAVLGAMV